MEEGCPTNTSDTVCLSSPSSRGICTAPGGHDKNQCHHTPASPSPPLFPPPLLTRRWGSPHSRGLRILTRPAVRKSVPCEAGLGSWPSYGNLQRPGRPPSAAIETRSKTAGNGRPKALAPKCGPHMRLRKFDLFRPDSVEPRRSRPCPWPAGYSAPGCPGPARPTSSSPCRGLDWCCCTRGS